MRILLALLLVALPAAPSQAVAPAPRTKASDPPRSAFIKKCFRDRTKQSCTAPPDARSNR